MYENIKAGSLGNPADFLNQCVQEKRQPEIASKLSALSVAVSSLESEIDMIGSALAPVTTQRPEKTPGTGIATAPSGTAMGSAVQNEIDRLYIIATRLRAIRESLEV